MGKISDPAPGHREAIQHFEHAVAIDTTFAVAWAELSSSIVGVYNAQETVAEGSGRALKAARRAVALAPGDPSGHLALGRYYESIARDAVSAVREYGIARQLAPDDERPLVALAGAEYGRANWPVSITLIQQLIQLQPDDVRSIARLAATMWLAGRFAEAGALAERGLALSPGDLGLWSVRTWAAVSTGDSAQVGAVMLRARRAADQTELAIRLACVGWSWTLDDSSRALLRRLRPSAFGGDLERGRCVAPGYWMEGDTAHARAIADSALREIRETERHPVVQTNGFVWAFQAIVYALLGRAQEAERSAHRAERLWPLASGINGVGVQMWLVVMDVVLGKPEEAVQRIRRVRSIAPGVFSPGELQLSPLFRSLRDRPSFKRLLAGVQELDSPS